MFCNILICCETYMIFFFHLFLLKKALSSQSDVSNPPPSMRILAGMTTGALAVISAQPTDVVKVRMQADCPLPGQPRRYAGSNLAYRTIAMEEGE